MSVLPRVDAATTAEWPDLVAELDRWGEAGQVASLWWRDDDAVAATPELASLLRLAGDVPLALAVIPAELDPDLPGLLQSMPQVAVLQHGWRHANHAMPGAKKSEYPATRNDAAVMAELMAGRGRLEACFGPQALRVVVPPWNRFAAELAPLLTKVGIAGLSSMASRAAPTLLAGVAAIDVHLDLTAWKGDRGFIGTAAALAGLIGHLRACRLGSAERAMATGILTHHLVMDRATAGFLDRLVAAVDRHAAARWAAVAELLAQ
jgi:hypothetical protein